MVTGYIIRYKIFLLKKSNSLMFLEERWGLHISPPPPPPAQTSLSKTWSLLAYKLGKCKGERGFRRGSGALWGMGLKDGCWRFLQLRPKKKEERPSFFLCSLIRSCESSPFGLGHAPMAVPRGLGCHAGCILAVRGGGVGGRDGGREEEDGPAVVRAPGV